MMSDEIVINLSDNFWKWGRGEEQVTGREGLLEQLTKLKGCLNCDAEVPHSEKDREEQLI